MDYLEKYSFHYILIGWEPAYSRGNAYTMEVFLGSVRLCLCLLYLLKCRNECSFPDEEM